MKAIDTFYRGFKFRSRLEARWAVFFDTMRLEWKYEPEGFDLGGGVFYLPDFKIKSAIDGKWYWVEIKPDEINKAEAVKAFKLAKQSEMSVLILLGDPRLMQYVSRQTANAKWARLDPVNDTVVSWYCEHGEYGSFIDKLSRDDERAVAALKAFRSARFEFGGGI